MTEDQDNFDLQLREHLARELDGQLGRAPAAFARSSRRRPWRVVATFAAMAAGIALVVTAILFFDRNHPIVQSSDPTTRTAPTATPIEYSLAWRTTDEGTVFVSDAALRGMRQERIETYRWTDPETKASIEVHVPDEDMVYIPLTTN